MPTHSYVYLNGGGYTPMYSGGGTNGNAPTPGSYSQQSTGTPSTPGPSQYIPPTVISNLGLFRSNMQVKLKWLLPNFVASLVINMWKHQVQVCVWVLCQTCQSLCISMWNFGYMLPTNFIQKMHSMHDRRICQLDNCFCVVLILFFLCDEKLPTEET